MRLWHKDLIPYLPRQQLLGQWRECCLIAKSIAEKGTPNHILVNRIMDYPINHFWAYVEEVCIEMEYRGYRCDFHKIEKYRPKDLDSVPTKYIFADWHNTRYLKQCFCNLQEKYDCGGISEKEWNKIINNISIKEL